MPNASSVQAFYDYLHALILWLACACPCRRRRSDLACEDRQSASIPDLRSEPQPYVLRKKAGSNWNFQSGKVNTIPNRHAAIIYDAGARSSQSVKQLENTATKTQSWSETGCCSARTETQKRGRTGKDRQIPIAIQWCKTQQIWWKYIRSIAQETQHGRLSLEVGFFGE